jgi:tRNA modification GTPase
MHIKECIMELEILENVEEKVLAAEHLRNAAHHIGKITGLIQTEEVLDFLFKEFCIGK